jgi:hypothetical protein
MTRTRRKNIANVKVKAVVRWRVVVERKQFLENEGKIMVR